MNRPRRQTREDREFAVYAAKMEAAAEAVLLALGDEKDVEAVKEVRRTRKEDWSECT